jgi:hypothetical protein
MRILVTESDPGHSQAVEATLTAAGHEVVRCTAPDEPAFPCVGLADGECPLDEPTDVALAVRTRPHPRPTPGETGVSCALRADVPLVVAGTHGLSPFTPWTIMTVDDDEDVVAVVEGAAGSAPAAVTEAAGEEARRLLGEEADVRVARDGDRLLVELIAPEEIDRQRATAVAVRVLGAARQVAQGARTLDIGLARDPDGA